MENNSQKAKEITIEKFTKDVDDILVKENIDCKSDLLLLKIFGISMVTSVTMLMLFLYGDGISYTSKATIVIVALFVYQAIYVLASIAARTARKTAAIVSILAVFTSMYQEMNTNALKQFFASIDNNEGTSEK